MADGDDLIPLADEEETLPEADEDEPVSPRKGARPDVGQPLPRLWKVDPEPEEDEGPKRKSRRERLAEEKASRDAEKGAAAPKRAKSEKGKKDVERAPGSVLLEATPESETYQARQRARILIGMGMLGVFGLGVYLLYRAIAGGPAPEPPGPGQGVASPAPTLKAPAALEEEAKILMGTAQQLAKNGNAPGAMAVLEKIIKGYPKTAIADEARAALERPAKNLPLFLDRPTVVAAPPATAPKPAPAPPAVVNVTTPAPAIKPGSTDVARLDLPPNPSEPPRITTPGPTPTAATPALKPIPAGFRARTEAGISPSGWPNQITSDRDGATMVLIPAGTFLQGRDNGPPEEAPEHKVNLGTFYVDQHEVTVGQFELYLKETGKQPPAKFSPKPQAKPGEADNLPAVNITAREAKAYCEWAGKYLPTEAQWEAAARTTDGRPHPWGAEPPKWDRERAPRQIDPVMSFPLDQSPYGLFDLAGNVWEFTKDYYDPNYYYQFKGRAADNPVGPAKPLRSPSQVVVKGVSKAWLASGREGLSVNSRFPFVGFRGVLPVEASSSPGTSAPAGNSPGSLPTTSGGIVPF
jgi:sulfatase modifying factor 1